MSRWKPPPGKRRVNIVLSEELYFELVRRVGFKRLSETIESAVKAALEGAPKMLPPPPPAPLPLDPLAPVELPIAEEKPLPEWVRENPWLSIISEKRSARA